MASAEYPDLLPDANGLLARGGGAESARAIDVLVVDDNPEILLIVRLALRAKGLSVVCADSGEEALDLLRALSPGVIVADVEMPGMSGHELCRAVRERDAVPFLFFSSHDGPEERARGLAEGADGFVAKSADLSELVVAVGRHLGADANSRAARLFQAS